MDINQFFARLHELGVNLDDRQLVHMCYVFFDDGRTNVAIDALGAFEEALIQQRVKNENAFFKSALRFHYQPNYSSRQRYAELEEIPF